MFAIPFTKHTRDSQCSLPTALFTVPVATTVPPTVKLAASLFAVDLSLSFEGDFGLGCRDVTEMLFIANEGRQDAS